ncbi:MAG TPA: type II CAAX endopeptidase family protein [Tenuifilaceae bacterium]|nr:type II CAAX endopeptidase family protein [Tenuifilaceae bacterium]HPE18862.1 type II CAAX endopeptidase family protein [Tenuifilaceae bacterium]HPJ46947.1 type II CAAX endopeptidase family protein [Tenuifilaceae bacterium]HPQ35426.1 type II CAAX endopeptidase family protein [Tenuifilaceae bacterium]
MNKTIKHTIIGLCSVAFIDVLITTNIFGLLVLEENITTIWISEFKIWLYLALVFLIATKVEQSKLLLWKESRKKWYFYVISAVAIFLGAVIVAVVTPILFDFLNIPKNQEVLESVGSYYCKNKILLVFGCLTAGIVEEFIYRGYLMPRIEILIKNKWMVITLTALLFGFAHIGNQSIIGLVVPTLIGFIFSYHYYTYRSISAVMIAHFIIDFASFLNSCQ